MQKKTKLHGVPMASTRFTTEAFFDGRENAIRFTYKENGVLRDSGIRFDGLCAVRMRAERCCTVWHIEDAYDTLVEIEDSPWVDEIRSDTQKQWRDHWAMHHYMIYLDSVGCFEMIAASWKAIEGE